MSELEYVLEQIQELLFCLDCGSLNLIIDEIRGDIICKNCGIVVEERIIERNNKELKIQTENQDKIS